VQGVSVLKTDLERSIRRRQILALAIGKMSRGIDISQSDKKFRENHRRFCSEQDALHFLAELLKAGERK
jgi:hypothetical protein